MTLMDLTGQESGIIVYEGNAVAVVNWQSMGENQFPMFGPLAGMMLGWPESEDVFDGVETEHVQDIRDVIPGKVWLTGETDGDGNRVADTDLDIVHDANADLARLFLVDTEPTAGTVYTLADGRCVIAPDGWA